MKTGSVLSVLLFAALATGAAAENVAAEHGFSVKNETVVAAPPAEVWARLLVPSTYWNPAHGYSGAAENYSLDAAPGGCFCEALPEGGFVEHMRVVMVQPGRTLRLAGALGPLQSEGLSGALTWTLEPVEGGTRLTQTYKVGGFSDFDWQAIAPAVDGVLREQLIRLAETFQ